MARAKTARGERRKKERSLASPKHPRLRRPAFWAAAGAAVSLAIALLRFDPYLFTGGDNAHYFALTRALATGRGYVDLIFPGAPPHTQYPPGFPSLLVPFYLLSGGSMVALKLESWIAGATVLWATYRLGRRDPAVPSWAAAAAVWTVGLYHVFQLYTHRVLSDMTYLALAVATLAVLHEPPSNERAATGRVDRCWLLGCAIALGAFYVRVAGVTLLAAIVVWALLRRFWKRAAAAAAVFAAGVLPWILWVRSAPSRTEGYLLPVLASNPLVVGGSRGRLGEFAERLYDTVVEYASFQLPQLFWPADPPPPGARVLGLLVGGSLLVYGIGRVLRSRDIAAWDLYVAATLALLPFWPWVGDRYFLTLVPFLWLYMLVGLDGASRRVTGGPSIAVTLVALLSAALLAAGAAGIPRQWERNRAWLRGDDLAGYTPFWADYFAAARWIGENAPPDAVILARKPTLAWYWSGRPSVTYPYGRPEAKWAFLRRQGVTYILLEPATEAALKEVLRSHRDRLSVAYETPRREVVVLSLASDSIPDRGP